MVSDRAKAQIGYLMPSRQRRTDHMHAIGTITDLILKKELQRSGQVRSICTELGWSSKSTNDLCAMVDDVGFTLLTIGIIEQW
jgi:hypothetical protein